MKESSRINEDAEGDVRPAWGRVELRWLAVLQMPDRFALHTRMRSAFQLSPPLPLAPFLSSTLMRADNAHRQAQIQSSLIDGRVNNPDSTWNGGVWGPGTTILIKLEWPAGPFGSDGVLTFSKRTFSGPVSQQDWGWLNDVFFFL